MGYSQSDFAEFGCSRETQDAEDNKIAGFFNRWKGGLFQMSEATQEKIAKIKRLLDSIENELVVCRQILQGEKS